MDTTEVITVLVAVLTTGASSFMIVQTLRRHRSSLRGEDPLQMHRFTRRRLFMAAILGIVAILLFLGVCVIDFGQSFHAWTWFWLTVLGLLVLLLFLALRDMAHIVRRIETWQKRPPTKGD